MLKVAITPNSLQQLFAAVTEDPRARVSLTFPNEKTSSPFDVFLTLRVEAAGQDIHLVLPTTDLIHG